MRSINIKLAMLLLLTRPLTQCLQLHTHDTTSPQFEETTTHTAYLHTVTKKNSHRHTDHQGHTTASIPYTSLSLNSSESTNSTSTTLSHERHPVFYAFDIFSNFPYVILGVIGNLFTVLVLRTKSMRALSATTFFTALALSDTTVSLISEAQVLSKLVNNLVYYQINLILCRFHMIMLSTFMSFSRFILIGLCIERCIALFAPLKSASIISQFRNKLYLIVSLILSVSINIPDTVRYGYTIQLHDNSSDTSPAVVCSSQNGDEMQYGYYTVFLVSVIVVFCSNCMVLTLVMRSGRMMGKTMGNKDTSVKRSVTRMMLATCMCDFLLNMPLLILTVIMPYMDIQLAYTLLDFSHLLITYNHTLNFLLYLASGRQFRDTAKSLLFQILGKSTVKNQASTQSTTLSSQ